MDNNDQIRFCSYCGTKLDKGAKFCKGCGKAVMQTAQTDSEFKTINDSSDEVFSNKINTERKTVYEGRLHKCPNCGELLKAFLKNCPTCGYEIRDAQVAGSVREFEMKLEQIESRQMPVFEENESMMKKIFGKDFRDKQKAEIAIKNWEEQKQREKVDLIKNFVVPNTKEDIMEFMLLASSNIDIKHGIVVKHGILFIDYTYDEFTKAWISKLEQVYEKAKIFMGNTSDFAQIKDIYNQKKKEINGKKMKKILSIFGSIAILFLIVVLGKMIK